MPAACSRLPEAVFSTRHCHVAHQACNSDALLATPRLQPRQKRSPTPQQVDPEAEHKRPSGLPAWSPVQWHDFSQVYRWAFFFCGFVPIFWISRAAVHLLVIVVEYAFFTSKVMYYLYGIRVRPRPSLLGSRLGALFWVLSSARFDGLRAVGWLHTSMPFSKVLKHLYGIWTMVCRAWEPSASSNPGVRARFWWIMVCSPSLKVMYHRLSSIWVRPQVAIAHQSCVFSSMGQPVGNGA